MTAKKSKRAHAPLKPEPQSDTRPCEWPGCAHEGEHRAPRSREHLNTYRWFCLEHIRIYNKSWNYYAGMDESQVEDDVRRDTVWDRPTWRLGTNAGAFGFGETIDPFGVFSEDGSTAKPGNGSDTPDAGASPIRPPVSAEEEQAYRVLGIEYPIDAEAVKVRYKALVKKHHPDANEGSKSSEERLKEINHAYHVVRVSFDA